MTRHTERFVAWYDIETSGPHWKVIDLAHNDPSTHSGKEELAAVRNRDLAYSLAMDLEAHD